VDGQKCGGVDPVKEARKIRGYGSSTPSSKTTRVYTLKMENGDAAAKVLYTGWAGAEKRAGKLDDSLWPRGRVVHTAVWDTPTV